MRRAWGMAVVALLLLATSAAAEDKDYRASFALRLLSETPLGFQVGIDRSLWVPHPWVRARAGVQVAWSPLIGVGPTHHRELDANGELLLDWRIRVVDLRLSGVGELSLGAEHARLQLGLLFLLGPQFYFREEHFFMKRLDLSGDYRHTELVLDSGVGLMLRGRITPAIGTQLGYVYDVIDFSKSYALLSVYYAF